MKKLLAVLLVCALLFALTACTTPAPDSVPTDDANVEQPTDAPDTDADDGNKESTEPVEVLWWTAFGQTNVDYLQVIIDAFNESQNEYHVTIEFQGNQTELNAKLQSTAKDSLPSMFSGPIENVAMYANAEYCVPLQGFIDADTEGWPELESTWEAIRTAYQDNEGNQIGYPIGYSYPGLYYNADMLAEAGIDPFEIKSMNDLYDACVTLVKGGYATYGVGFHPDGFYFNAALGREGLQAYNNNNGLGAERITECLYTSDQAVHDAIYNMLEIYQKLHAEKLCVPYGAGYQDEIIPQMAAGDCAMFIGVVSMTTKILDSVNGAFEVGIVPMVSATENGKCSGEPAGGTGLWICNIDDAAQQQGAYEFIKFASTGDQAAYFATATGYLAPNQESYNSELYQDYVADTFPAISVAYDSLAASDDSATNPYIPISNEMKVANKLAIETVANDPNADIDAVINTAYETLQEAIELYNLSNP